MRQTIPADPSPVNSEFIQIQQTEGVPEWNGSMRSLGSREGREAVLPGGSRATAPHPGTMKPGQIPAAWKDGAPQGEIPRFYNSPFKELQTQMHPRSQPALNQGFASISSKHPSSGS